MTKPQTLDGYSDAHTGDCERVLVTLLRGMGPWKDSIYLIGGLTPRYLVPERPPDVPAHAGTLDVDVVVHLQILTDTEAYNTLEENLKRMGFERAKNEQGEKVSWRWQIEAENGALMVLELLADAPHLAGGRVEALPTKGTLSALNIPHSSIVFDLYQVAEISAELIGGNGVATERVKHADIVSFTCLKAFALDERYARKDAHDLVYCIEHAPRGLDMVVAAFGHALANKHAAVVREALNFLLKHFADDAKTEGHRKDGPVAVAKFELGDADGPEQRERRILRQRQASDVIGRLLAGLG
jgi:hypothetical protein